MSLLMNKNILGKLLLAVIVFSLVFLWNNYNHDKVNAIAVATVTSKVNGLKKNKVSYELSIDGVEYRSTYHGQSGSDAHVGDKYVAVYESSNPKNNNIIFSLRYKNELQIDSLKREVNPQDLINWWD